ncbi:MAG TPA: efflux RND transporter permease subunit [Gaiella sp.]
MMRTIVRSSITFRLLVAAVAAAGLVVGAVELRRMPVEVLPDFTPTTVEVQTEALGLSAAEVEQLITVPVEQDLLNGVAFLDDIRSESVPGLSRILMIFEPGTDVFEARQVVAERLTQAAALPQVSRPPRMMQPISSTDRAMLFGLSSNGLSALQLGMLARWTIAPRLQDVPGVANVSIWGERDRQLQVQVDPARLKRQGVGLEQVVRTSANALSASKLTFVEASTTGSGGFLDTSNQRLEIRHESPISTPAELAHVRLDDTHGRELVLGDVARLVEGSQPLIGDAVVADKPGLLLVIQRSPNANLLTVTRGVTRALEQMKPGLAGVDVDANVYRPASYVEESINNLRLAALVVLGLLAVVLGAFLFGWRTALIALVVIPLSLVTASLVLWAFGRTMNVSVLVGLVAALALVIDDAVVSVENITRRLHREESERLARPTARTVLEASLEVGRPTLYATLVVALAVVPLFFLERLSGAFLPDIAAVYLIALLASMVVALTVTPALCVLLLSRTRPDGTSPLLRRLGSGYEAGLSSILHRPRVGYLAIGGLLVLAGVSMPFLGQSLLPTLKENEVLIRWDGPPGTSLPEMDRVTARATHELRSLPGVRDVGAHVGRARSGDQIVGVNSAEIWVDMDPAADHDATLAFIHRVVDGYPGLAHTVETYSEQRLGDLLEGSDDDVVVRVYGENLKTLTNQAKRVQEAIGRIDGVADPRVLRPPEEPTLHVQVDLRKANAYGIAPGDVRRAATTHFSGLAVGSVFERDKIFDVVVWDTPAARASESSVRDLLIDTPSGGRVRLGDVANVRIAPSPSIIKRQAVSRYVDVSASVSGRDRDAVARDVNRRLEGMRFPIEYDAKVIGSDRQPTGRLLGIGVTAVIGMFLLLQAFFGSWRLAMLSILTLPLGLAGGLVAVAVSGGTLSFGSYLALFAVLGISARGELLLFDRFRHLEQDEGEAFGTGLILRGARERLGPAAMTALATGLLSVVVLVLGSRPGLELVQPMAVVLVGGLISSILLCLVVLPILYLRFGFSRAAEDDPAAMGDDLTAALSPPARRGVAGGIVMTETRMEEEAR